MPVEGRPPWVPSPEDIERVAHEIAEKFESERIILFGSYAYGNPTDDSDVDMLVVMETEKRPIEVGVRIRTAVMPSFAWDVLVRDPAEIERRIGLSDWFLNPYKEITNKGEVFYERPHARVGSART